MATWVMHTISGTSYWGIVLLMVVENVFPPIPSEVIMPLAGFMATQGQLSLLGVILAGTLGSVLGAVPLYYLGRRIGDERLKAFADRHGRWLTVSRHDLDHAKQWFDRHGRMAVLFCRLVPGVRSLISIPAAFARLLRIHVEGAGLSVAVTDRAERALELVRQAPPRALLVDLQLAGAMDGWDLLIALKSDPAWHALPVLIISASAEANSRGLALGGADYLLKPVARDALLHAVRRRLPARPGTTVLVADDDAAFRDQVRAYLAAAREIRVVEAANGREALVSLAQHMPDLLVLDLLMPDVDGFEVLRQLRTDKRAMNLPVLVVTGKDLHASEKAALKRHLASLVSKQEASLDYFARIIEHVLGAETGRRAPR
jgi:CheY-like chemotaxis protein